jgi:hypothetical protein
MFKYIADIAHYTLRTWIDDITNYFSLELFQLCWSICTFEKETLLPLNNKTAKKPALGIFQQSL